MKMEKKTGHRNRRGRGKALLGALLALSFALLSFQAGAVGLAGGSEEQGSAETELISPFWPSVFEQQTYQEPAFEDSAERTNNAFNVEDFGEQGTNGWFYRYGNSKRPHRSERITNFDGERYFQPGANGLEIKKNFLHTAQGISPILEWRAAQNGKVKIDVTYVKNVNGDANPGYPDGVQLMVYQGEELLKFEIVNISTETENLAEIAIDELDVKQGDSLYFVVDPRNNNAFDGGSLYINIRDAGAAAASLDGAGGRKDNNANSVTDFGAQGSNGWRYMYGTSPEDCQLVSNQNEGEYINGTSPNLSISQGFIHPALNHNAVLAWTPAKKGYVDLRLKYTKFAQNDGNPDFPDGVTVRAYRNSELLYETHVDSPVAEGENKVSFREPKLSVTPGDCLFFMVDAEGNASYDGGAFDITLIDIGAAKDEGSVSVNQPDTRQNFADVMADFGPQGSNGWMFQCGYGDDPFHAYNLDSFSKKEDRYFDKSWLEIKRDYVNVGENGRSAVIKWRVAQNGRVKIKASYTKMKNEDANPAWPDGTRVSVYYNNELLRQQSFAPETDKEVTKRLDVSSLKVKKGGYITMVINGLENNAYDGGKYEFAISSISGLVGKTEKNVKATYDGAKENFASTKDDFGKQGHNGWYYQYSYYDNPFFAVNVELCEKKEKYYTSDGVEIKKDYIVPSNKGKCAQVKWVAAKSGTINIDLEYTKLLNEDANPAWPDGVTVYLMKNHRVLRKRYFAPLRSKEVTKSLAKNNVRVKKGDCITMIVDPGKNSAYDGGKYMFVIEDAKQVPKVRTGNWDNDTSLGELTSMKQGTDGWYFLEGRTPADARVLTKMNKDKTGYLSRRADGLEMRNGFAHTGDIRDPIFQWVVGKTGKIDVGGEYVKFGQEDPNPKLPDGVTVKVWKNRKQIFKKKVKVKRGDGNNNVVSFNFDALKVKRGDKLSFQICADKNYAWDGGNLAVSIQPSRKLNVKPGDDNNTSLGQLGSIDQGTDGWWFLEGTSPKKAKLLTKRNADGTAYVSRRTEALEMKPDYVHPGATQDAIYMWVAAKNGKVDLSGSYVKFGQAHSNPSYPDGVTLKIWKNGKSILTRKVKAKRGDGNDNTIAFSFDALKVKRGDRISFQISSDKNYAWDAGKLSVAIEESSNVVIQPGDDNNTSLSDLSSMEQGTDGWYFLEGSSPDKAKPLSKMNDDKTAYVSRKTNGLEMKKDGVHPGESQDAIYQWVVAKNGKVDVAGSYTKFGQEDNNPDWPDGVTLKVWHNGKSLLSKKVEVKRGDGNNNVVSFGFDALEVKRGDKLSFQICADKNNAWDGGVLMVSIEETSELAFQPGDDNNTSLGGLGSMEQGTDGWYFLEGSSPDKAKALKKMNDGKDAYLSTKTSGLEMKKDYVHTGATLDPIYTWVVAKDGKVDVSGSYTKYGQNSDNPTGPDGVTLKIWHNGTSKLSQKVAVKQGDGNNNVFSFSFDALEVKRGDRLSFQICADGNNDWDAGALMVSIEETETLNRTPGDDNNTILANIPSMEQGTDGWWFVEGTSLNKVKLLTNGDENGYTSVRDSGLEMKRDYVHTGANNSAIYQWVVKDGGSLDVKGSYVKYGHNDGNPDWPDGVTVTIWQNNQQLWQQNVKALQGDGNDNTVNFDFTGANALTVAAGDILSFQIAPNGNNAWDAGKLAVIIGDEGASQPDEVEPDPNRDNSADLAADFSSKQGNNGWYYGTCDWDSKNFTKLFYDAENERYYNNGKPELKKDFVEPGQGKNAAYKWVVAKDGKINVKGSYTKFANSEGTGTCVRIFLNGAEKKWLGTTGTSDTDRTVDFDESYEVKKGDELIFAVNPEGDDAWDGGKLIATISEDTSEPAKPDEEEPAADRTNNTVLADDFTGVQGRNGWYYGTCEWDSKDFSKLFYDAENGRYYNNGKPELKKDFVEPGQGKNAAYKWVAAQDGKINVKGSYTKFANTEGNGTCVRIFLNGTEKKWLGTTGTSDTDRTESFDETFEVKQGDELIFAVNPEGNDSYDGGRLTVAISEEVTEDGNPVEVKPNPNRTNTANLASDFSGKQGNNGWYYGKCDWDSNNFEKLFYDAENSRYYNSGKPELKKDFVEPGQGRNAGYKWVAAQDGEIKVTGKYVKFNGGKTAFRIRLNGDEKLFAGMDGSDGEKSHDIDLTLTVKKGDELVFHVDTEGDDDDDGGRLEIDIKPVEVQPEEVHPLSALADDIAELIDPKDDDTASEDEAPESDEAEPEDEDKSNNEDEEKSEEKDEDKSGDKSDKKDEDKPEEQSDKKDEEKTEDRSGDKSEQKTEDKSGDKSDKKDEDKPEEQSDKKDEEKTEDKSGDKSEQKTEDKSEEQSDKKDEEKSEDKSDKKDEDKPEEQSDKKDEEKAEDKSDKKDEEKSEDKSDKKDEGKSEDKSDKKDEEKSEDKSEEKSESKEKKQNSITCEELLFCTTNSKKAQTVKLGAKVKGDAELSYKSDNKKVKVEKGKVKVPKGFLGKVTITIKSAETDEYKAAKAETVVMVGPAPVSLTGAKAEKKSVVKVSWEKNKNADGYEIQYSRDKSFGENSKKKAKTIKINKNSTLKKSIKKLKKGTWYVRVRTVKKKACSDWSKSKKVKVK